MWVLDRIFLYIPQKVNISNSFPFFYDVRHDIHLVVRQFVCDSAWSHQISQFGSSAGQSPLSNRCATTRRASIFFVIGNRPL